MLGLNSEWSRTMLLEQSVSNNGKQCTVNRSIIMEKKCFWWDIEGFLMHITRVGTYSNNAYSFQHRRECDLNTIDETIKNNTRL